MKPTLSALLTVLALSTFGCFQAPAAGEEVDGSGSAQTISAGADREAAAIIGEMLARDSFSEEIPEMLPARSGNAWRAGLMRDAATGREAIVFDEIDASGARVDRLVFLDPAPGGPMTTTIDGERVPVGLVGGLAANSVPELAAAVERFKADAAVFAGDASGVRPQAGVGETGCTGDDMKQARRIGYWGMGLIVVATIGFCVGTAGTGCVAGVAMAGTAATSAGMIYRGTSCAAGDDE